MSRSQAGEAGHVLGQDRVPLVRHRGGALLAGGEGLQDLPHLGALEVADLDRDALAAPGEERELGEEARVAVARHDLGRDRLRTKAEPPQDGGLDRGLDVGEGADGARELAVGDRGPRHAEPAPAARQLGVPARALEAEGDDLGVDAVRAPDHGRAPMAERLAADCGAQAVEADEQEIRRVAQLEGEGRVHHVRGGEPQVEEAPLVAHLLGERRHERDHVVLHLGLDRLHARDVDAHLGPQRARGLDRYLAPLGEHVDQRQLDLEPAREAGLLGPEPAHLGAGVAG